VIDLPSKKLKVGYINIPKFYRDFSDRSGRNCTDDTRRELQKLTSRGVSGVILDLRNNGGGALEDAKLISGLFIDKGPVVQVKATGNSIDVLEDSDGKIEFEKPLIVLINRFSASASEIVAAALQDYKRAIIVGGEFTHGKGTVQMVVELDNNAPMIARDMPLGALKVTIQKFYRIDGGSTQYRGVTPDVILPDPYAYMETGEKFLKFSIPWGEVKPLKFKPLKPTYDVKKILLNSKKRVTQNPRFKKMMDVIAWYKTRKDKTVRSLKESDFVTERKELEKKSEELKEEVENKDLVIEFAESPADPVQKEKQDDFAKELRQDPTIEESVYIIADMLGV
jgi:carboxyl-terminal processing protease